MTLDKALVSLTGVGVPPFSLDGRRLVSVLERHTPVNGQLRQAALTLAGASSSASVEAAAAVLARSLWLFLGAQALPVLTELDEATQGAYQLSPRNQAVPIVEQSSLVRVRNAAMALSDRFGFRPMQRTRFATVASELTRNVLAYAGHGEALFTVLTGARLGVTLTVVDSGPGIADVELVFSGDYRSKTGLGMGLRGARAVSDELTVESTPGQGTVVTATFLCASGPSQRLAAP